jgi:hypothetical protein
MRFGTPFIFIFQWAAREPAHNIGCGFLAIKSFLAHGKEQKVTV